MNVKTRLASQSSIMFGMRLVGAGMIVVIQAAIARLWSAEILGEFLLTMAVVNLLAMAMPLGFQTVATYFAAEYRANDQGDMLGRFIFRAYSHILIAATIIFGIGVYLSSNGGAGAAQFFSSLISDDIAFVFGNFWIQGAILACAVGVVFINGAVLVGLKRPYAGYAAEVLFRPMLVIGAFVLALAIADPSGRLDVMLWAFSLGYGFVALVHFSVVLSSVRKLPITAGEKENDSARWWRFALPWVLIDLATSFFFDIDIIMLSGLMDKSTLAIFAVCTRIFSLVAFGVTAVYAVALPDIFESAAKSDTEEFNRKVGDANLVAAALSLVFLGVILIVGPFILMIFGPDFLAGAMPLAILCLALVVRSVFGPAALVLSINDRPWASVPAIGVSMLALGVGNFYLVPIWGLIGAALSALIAFVVWSVLMWWTALKITGVDVSVFPRLRQIISDRLIKAR